MLRFTLQPLLYSMQRGSPVSSTVAAWSAALLLACAASASAQDAEVHGIVRDTSGAVVPGASVTLAHPATGQEQTLTTDGAGRYAFALLSPGDYVLTVALQGFQSARDTLAIDTGSIL